MNPEDKLVELIGCRTVSDADERNESEFAKFRSVFAELFPLIHAQLELTVINDGTLLFRWQGRSDHKPIVLMAHYDVVPAPAEQWRDDPFTAVVVDGFVVGRGALDDKGPLVAIAEAVEQLLAQGHVPEQDVWLSFGHDEEVFGSGAAAVVEHFRTLGIRPWLVNDEGGAIVEKAIPGLRGKQAMIAIAEKGTVDIELLATGSGGHASVPMPNGPTARLAKAIVRIEENQSPPRLSEPIIAMIDALTSKAPSPLKTLIGQAERLDRPLAQLLALAGPEASSMVRTTIAVTKLSGSPANNVLATEARANLNVRLAIGDTIEELVARLTKLLRGLDVAIVNINGDNPPPVSSVDSQAWRHLVDTLNDFDPEILPIPYVLTGGTDSRHFAHISSSVFRFAPLEMSREQRQSIHAANESVAVASLRAGVDFYRALLTRPLPG